MPWAKVDTATNLVTDLFENEPTLDADEVGKVAVIEVEEDVEIGDEVDVTDEPGTAPSPSDPGQAPPNAVPSAG